jgi:iron complex outermembrane receptor protein
VLKGPQGTLFGPNTTGGAMLFVPQMPTDRLDGYVEASAGDYNMWRGQGVLSVRLSDTFKVRLGVDRNHRGGYMKNHSGLGPDDFNDLDYFAARAGIVANLTPDLENYMLATYTHSFTSGFAPRVRLCLTNGIVPRFTLSAGQARTAGAACAQIARQNARGDGPLDVEFGDANACLDIEQWRVINTTIWHASDALTIKNIISYVEFTENSDFNLNGDNFFITNPPPPGVATSFIGTRFVQTQLGPQPGVDNASQSGFTEEPQFQGRTSDNRFVWQAGGYLEVSDPLGWSSGYNPGLLPATNLLNVNVNWNDVMGMPVDAAFFMTNVTNEIHPVNVSRGLGSAGFEDFIYGAPRMWGFRLRYRFGQ